MADNFQTDPGTGGVTFKSTDVATVHTPAAKVAFGGAGVSTDVADADGSRLPVKPPTNATGAVSRVTASASSVTVLAANANRVGAALYNESTATLRLKFGVTAAAADYTIAVFPDGFFVVPAGYTGRIDGIWDAANGAAQVTEW